MLVTIKISWLPYVIENTKNVVVHERGKIIYCLSSIIQKLFCRNLLLVLKGKLLEIARKRSIKNFLPLSWLHTKFQS